jgi:RNA-directed DNA polymerase
MVRAGIGETRLPGLRQWSSGKVRQLQRGLRAAARQSPERRFHALYDRICRGDVLWEAWEPVRAKKGAAGVDRITLT